MIDIAAQIPPKSKRVVELGVSREKAGEAFLRIQPQAEYFGVAANPAEMREAAPFLTHAFCALPETLDFEAMGIAEVDVLIVHGDFIRALTAERLRQWSQVLRAEGQLILAVPNACYIRPYLERLAGKAASVGSFGMTFGEAGEILRKAGLHTLEAQGSLADEDEALRQGEESKALLSCLQAMASQFGGAIGKERNPWIKEFFFKVVRQVPREEDRLMIQTALGEAIVTPRVRVYEPNGFLSTEPKVTAMVVNRSTDQNINAVAARFRQKVFIRQRLSYESAEQAFGTVKALRKRGYLIVAEMDDNPNAFMKNDRGAEVLSYVGTHAMQVSTDALAEVLKPYNPYIAVFRNELKELPARRNYEEERLQRLAGGGDYVTFFFGALNRTQEWQQVMPIINEAAKKYGSRLRFKVLSDRGFFEALETEHKEYIGTKDMYGGQFVPYEMYTEALHSSDISFLPLRDNDFNRTKSDLKFIESAGHGAAVLASPTVYEATVREGRTGFIYRSPKEFKNCLELLVENQERRMEMAEAAYEYVKRERMLADHYLERLAWYEEMISRREELDAAMMKRLHRWQELQTGNEEKR